MNGHDKDISVWRQSVFLKRRKLSRPFHHFNDILAICVIVIPLCTDDLLLHFPYDTDFNDITCHHAIGVKYGAGVVSIVNDTVRGRVAWFDGNARLEV